MLRKCDIYLDDEKKTIILVPIDDNKPIKIVYESSEDGLNDLDFELFLERAKNC